MATYVITGAAGFIGSHLASRLLETGHDVVGVDVADGTGPGGLAALRQQRLAPLLAHPGMTLHVLDIADEQAVATVAESLTTTPTAIVHLAARAGVRASVAEPRAFVRTNVLGFTNVAELAVATGTPHLVYASSSSVYGGLEKVPFTPSDPVGHPVSVYAATKRADELLAHAYGHLHGLPTTGLRFFTVYGPRGRPDMAYWRFAESILAGRAVEIYGDGAAVRDFTYVEDIVDALVALLGRPASPDPTWARASPDAATAGVPFALHNIGHGGQVSVLGLVRALEAELDVTADVRHLPPRAGDVPRTWSDTSSLHAAVGGVPSTPLQVGIARFAAWFRPWFEQHGSLR